MAPYRGSDIRGSRILLVVVGLLLIWEYFAAPLKRGPDPAWLFHYDLHLTEGLAGFALSFYGLLTLFRRRGDADDPRSTESDDDGPSNRPGEGG